MSKVVFFSSLIPNEYKEYYRENSIGAVSNANNSLQWALVKGFIMNNYNVKLLNFPNIGAYPTRFKKMITKSFVFTDKDSVIGSNIGGLNLNIIKHITFYFRLKRIILSTNFLNDENILIIYDLYPPFLKILKKIKYNNPSLKILLVIPDIHGLTGGKENILRKIIQYFDKKIIDQNMKYVDAFVLLTESMKEKLPDYVRNKPITIVEGIFNPENLLYESNVHINSGNKKIILYTGSLDIRHGIINLIKAFIKANISTAELHICGDGDGKKQILNMIDGNNSILYLGQLTREESIKKQQESFLLVNPRTSEGEFTKYSFPSKIIEYLASGTPTLIYKLEGIPAEYYDYCFYLEDESIEALSSKLIEIINEDKGKLKEKSLAARNFIINQKNAYKQVEKIIHLIQYVL
jgi:glycosyltransferase involved in cell wall biosynthesis